MGLKEAYILIFLAILPILYKYSFWFFTLQLKEYRIDRFFEYIKTPQGKRALFHNLFLLEVIFVITFVYHIFVSDFYQTFFYILVGILIIENIFVLYKIFKKQFLHPRLTFRLAFTILVLLIIETIYFFTIDFIVFLLINICIPLVLIGVAIFISYPVVKHLKLKKFKDASLVSKKYKNVVKVGITGSYGKTSGKEYLVQILSKKFKVLSTQKNINTEMGISDLIVNKLNDKYDYFVAEMGAYKIGEIKQIGEIVNHKYGFITAIGNQHLALFGGIKETMKAKSEIAEKVLKNKGILYINRNNKTVRKLKFTKKLNVVKYGTIKGCDAKAKVIEIDGNLTKFNFSYKGKENTFKTNLIGNHNIVNITGVIAFCLDIGMKRSDLKDIIKNLKFPENTLELINLKENLVLNDTYNLSEGGLLAGLETMNSFKNTKEKILIIDDILELGEKSGDIHFKIGKKLARNKLVTKVLFVGINYRDSFVKGLIDGGLKLSDIVNNLDFVSKNDILIFEGRRAKKELEKFLNNKK